MMLTVPFLLEAMNAVPRHPAVIDAMRRVRDLLASIPADPGDDGERTYVVAIEMDDIARRLYVSGAVACMNENGRQAIKDVKDAVSRVKNALFEIIGLPPDPV